MELPQPDKEYLHLTQSKHDIWWITENFLHEIRNKRRTTTVTISIQPWTRDTLSVLRQGGNTGIKIRKKQNYLYLPAWIFLFIWDFQMPIFHTDLIFETCSVSRNCRDDGLGCWFVGIYLLWEVSPPSSEQGHLGPSPTPWGTTSVQLGFLHDTSGHSVPRSPAGPPEPLICPPMLDHSARPPTWLPRGSCLFWVPFNFSGVIWLNPPCLQR